MLQCITQRGAKIEKHQKKWKLKIIYLFIYYIDTANWGLKVPSYHFRSLNNSISWIIKGIKMNMIHYQARTLTWIIKQYFLTFLYLKKINFKKWFFISISKKPFQSFNTPLTDLIHYISALTYIWYIRCFRVDKKSLAYIEELGTFEP